MDEFAANGQPRAGEIRILDDDREVLAYLLRGVSGLGAAVPGYDDPDQFLHEAEPPPACLVVDWQLRGRDGLEVIAQCQRQWPAVPVILITGHATIPVAVTAMRQGVIGVLEKPVLPAHLVREIQFALQKSQSRSAAAVERGQARRQLESLTEHELTVLKMIVSGTPNKNIAGQLRVAMRTAEKYRRAVFDKLGVDSAAEATRIWVLANQEP